MKAQRRTVPRTKCVVLNLVAFDRLIASEAWRPCSKTHADCFCEAEGQPTVLDPSADEIAQSRIAQLRFGRHKTPVTSRTKTYVCIQRSRIVAKYYAHEIHARTDLGRQI